MTVLVAAASKHGSTQEIAEAIGRSLAESGVTVEVMKLETLVDRSVDLSQYEAVVLGSAVYRGEWRKAAQEFIERYASELSGMPTWIFSSGPLGEPPRPDISDAVRLNQITSVFAPRDHHLFSGKIDRSQLGFGERAIMSAVRAAEGDFRDWDEIEAWAHEIAEALTG